MRYKADQIIPKEQLAAHSSDDMLMLTAVMGFFIGIILTYLGYRSQIIWLKVWSFGLIFVSLYLGYSIYNLT